VRNKHKARRAQSRSDLQTTAEALVIDKLGHELGIALRPQAIPVDDCKVCVDGIGQNDQQKKIILVESWAHVGPAKPAQVKKVLADVLKLHLAGAALAERFPGYSVEKLIAFVDKDAMNVLTNKRWGAAAAKRLGVKARMVSVGEEFLEGIRAAQKDQDFYCED
jgi:hypothetical protein